MAAIGSRSSRVLDLPPSCIAFSQCYRDLLVVGTYHLHATDEKNVASSLASRDLHNSEDATVIPESSERTGSLIVCRLENNDNISIVSTIQAPAAVLDLKWSPHDPDLLAIATSTGQLAFYRLTINNDQVTLELLSLHQLADPSTLVFYLTFHPLHPHILGLTFSTGAITLCTFPSPLSTSSPFPTPSLLELTTHSLEPWILTFLPTNDPTSIPVLSGGDDATLILTRCALPSTSTSTSTSTSSTDGSADKPITLLRDRRIHQAGITFLLPLAPASFTTIAPRADWELTGSLFSSERGQLVISGSYDDYIRLLRLPASGPMRAVVLAEENLEGGVWRVEVLSVSSSPREGEGVAASEGKGGVDVRLLVSCMYVGARVVVLSWRGDEGEKEGEWKFEVVGRFEEHASMNYASATRPVEEGGEEAGERRIVSTSFYDRLMCVWRF